MKTVKKISIVFILVALIAAGVQFSGKCFSRIKPCLKESTHQGYRTMVADYIF